VRVARRHVVLVGLSGAGKTTVGRLVAARLGAPFVDLDKAVEERVGRSIRRIFAEDGEPAFRAVEAACAREVLSGPPTILAAGGGYLENEESRAVARVAGLVIYLMVGVDSAVARLAGLEDRPLLEGADRAARLGELFERRKRGYLEAEHTVATDERTPEAVADEVASLARRHGGW
jgi:shikimate kinase